MVIPIVNVAVGGDGRDACGGGGGLGADGSAWTHSHQSSVCDTGNQCCMTCWRIRYWERKYG